ncbi:MAG: hypothetical protein IPK65_08620 [Gammaproteobacteria bacterium]|nr:hypothetical protein [Gammaproteobacteria bacterium]
MKHLTICEFDCVFNQSRYCYTFSSTLSARSNVSRATLIFMCFAISCVASFSAYSLDFEDSFELGNMSATNAEGFTWRSPVRTEIVNSSHTIWRNHSAVDIAKPVGLNWIPKEGLNSLRFKWTARSTPTVEANFWSEQRFDLGTPHKDIWFRYWLRVPTNFKHGYVGTTNTNNKLFALWMDGYETHGFGPSLIWGFWLPSETPGTDYGSEISFHIKEGGPGGAGGEQQRARFITYPTDQSRWMQVVFHAKASTNNTSHDGVVQMWRRWENETDFTMLHERLHLNIPSPKGGPDGWKAGYLMGWSNPGYEEDTEWLIDSFTVSETCLLELNCVANPKPPNSFRVIDP